MKLDIQCLHCNSEIDKSISSYYVKQEVKHGYIEELSFCKLECLDKYDVAKKSVAG